MRRRSTEISAPREAGAHYTPDALARAFAAEAVRVWESRWGGLTDHALWERETDVLDPACGDGALLLACLHTISERLADTPKHRALRTPRDALVQRMVQRVRGVELRADAAETARARGLSVDVGDGLRAEANGVLVVMNPPWVGRSKRSPEQTQQLRAITGQAASDYCVAFLRAYPAARQISAILPKAATEGDNRVAGLAWMVARGWRIASATSAEKWPGVASVQYVTVHLVR